MNRAAKVQSLAVGVWVSIDAAEWTGLDAMQRDQIRRAAPDTVRIQDERIVWRKVAGALEAGPITDAETLETLRVLATRFGVALVEERRS